MFERLANWLADHLGPFGPQLAVMICAMIPVVELRGAIPLGAAMGLDWWWSFLFAFIGNMIPVPFILLFIGKILIWMKGRKKLSKIALWIEAKAKKHENEITKYAVFGLAVFVAIPLPGTGAWTGALIAALLGMKFWKSFISIGAGVITAGVIMTLVSYTFKKFFGDKGISVWVWLIVAAVLVGICVLIWFVRRRKKGKNDQTSESGPPEAE